MSSGPGYDSDGTSQGYNQDGDSLGGMTYSVAYVIPNDEVNGDGTIRRFVDPNTGGNAPGYVGDYVTGSVGGGNNTLGRDDGLIDTSTGGSFNETGDFSDVGYVEDYAIPSQDYIDENLYPDTKVVQGPGTGLGVDQGKGYSEVYEIPYTMATDTPLTDGADTVGAIAYQDPNTGGALSLIHI